MLLHLTVCVSVSHQHRPVCAGSAGRLIPHNNGRSDNQTMHVSGCWHTHCVNTTLCFSRYYETDRSEEASDVLVLARLDHIRRVSLSVWSWKQRPPSSQRLLIQYFYSLYVSVQFIRVKGQLLAPAKAPASVSFATNVLGQNMKQNKISHIYWKLVNAANLFCQDFYFIFIFVPEERGEENNNSLIYLI